MKKTQQKIIFTIFATLLLNGCTALIPNSMIKAAHQDMDTNNDGYIDYNEYLKSGSKEDIAKEAKERGMTKKEYLKWDFNRADGNKDGKITAQELINMAKEE